MLLENMSTEAIFEKIKSDEKISGDLKIHELIYQNGETLKYVAFDTPWSLPFQKPWFRYVYWQQKDQTRSSFFPRWDDTNDHLPSNPYK